MSVEPVSGVEREEGRDTYDDRPQDLVPDVEVVVGKAARLVRQNAMIRILGGILRHADPKRPALFHALEDEVDTESLPLLHATQRRQNVILFANTLLSPLDRDLVVAGVGIHPVPVIVGSLPEHFLAHHWNPEDLANEVDHLFGPGQPAEIPVDDNAVEAVIYKNQHAAKQLCKSLHRSPPSVLVLTTRSSDRRPVDSKFQISLASFPRASSPCGRQP